MFTDTDSLVYEIKDKNVYEQCFQDKKLFDFSGYSKDSVLGKMKDEFNEVKIIEFDDKEVNKAKGINKKLRYKGSHYVLFNKKAIRQNMKRIQSKLHEIGTYDVFKISLSCFDDKRYVLDDGINTLAYFQKDIAC